MNDYYDDLKDYLNQGPSKQLGKKRERAEIIEVIEDIPGSVSELPNRQKSMNTIALSTSKGLIALEVADQERRAILDGRIRNLIIPITGSEESILTVLLSSNGSLDYSS